MEVTYAELAGMLRQMQRAAAASMAQCERNAEPGYDSRRANDVALARGRGTTFSALLASVEVTLAQEGDEAVADVATFQRSYAEAESSQEATFAKSRGLSYFEERGRCEAYWDVDSILESWQRLDRIKADAPAH
jgi:hypothetical protein